MASQMHLKPDKPGSSRDSALAHAHRPRCRAALSNIRWLRRCRVVGRAPDGSETRRSLNPSDQVGRECPIAPAPCGCAFSCRATEWRGKATKTHGERIGREKAIPRRPAPGSTSPGALPSVRMTRSRYQARRPSRSPRKHDAPGEPSAPGGSVAEWPKMKVEQRSVAPHKC